MQTRHTAPDRDAMTGAYSRHHAGDLKRKRFLLDPEAPMPAAAGRLF